MSAERPDYPDHKTTGLDDQQARRERIAEMDIMPLIGAEAPPATFPHGLTLKDPPEAGWELPPKPSPIAFLDRARQMKQAPPTIGDVPPPAAA